MPPSPESRSPVTTALDISLLGIVVASIGFYADRFLAEAPSSTPDLVRFWAVPPDTKYISTMPQDKALLLLTRTESNTGGASGTASLGADPLWSLLLIVGLTLVVGGPVWAWMQR